MIINNKQIKKQSNPFPAMEREVLDFWEKAGIFEKSVKRDAPRGDYVFYDGPPFATGLPHYGHIVASVMKDAVPRYWTMRGFRVERKWGWDCHGLPIENLAEKELKLKDKNDIEKIGVEKFNDYCKSIVMRYAEEWKKTIKRIGRWVDMENDYKTMDPNYMESIWWVFKSLWDKGLIYQGHKAMHICPRCGTTLSNFEVTQGYKDIKDISVIAKFKIKDNANLRINANIANSNYANNNVYILAWTTTPWTLIGNVALAVGEDIDYAVVRCTSGIFTHDGSRHDESEISLPKTEYYILAKDRIEEVMKEKDYEIVEGVKIKGKDLVGLKYEPLFDYYTGKSGSTACEAVEPLANIENGWKIYPADFVNTEEGTGVVHIAPAFGEDDMNLGKEYNLPFVQHVDGTGRFKDEVKDFAGLEVKPKDDHMKTDIEIIKYLARKNLLFAKEKYEHSYPHCWRCDTPLLNYAAESWFVEVTKVRDELIKNNKNVSWVPGHIKEGRFGKWLEQARDWAISRNRYWGTPLPVWQCCPRNTKHATRNTAGCGNTEVIGSREELEKKMGSFYILRHGEARCNVEHIYSSKINDGMHLTDKGINDVEKTVEKLKDKKVELIISSDIDRAKQTADIIAKCLGVKVVYDKRLREVNFGDYDGRKITDKRVKKLADLMAQGKDFGFPHGDDLPSLVERIRDFYTDLVDKNLNKEILLISHGDALTVFEAMLSGNDYLGEIKKIHQERYIDNAELRELKYKAIDLHKQYVDKINWPCAKCGGAMQRIPEVLDCWFESGSMPYAQVHYPFTNKKKFEQGFPAEFIAEGVDQTRGWFYTLMVLSSALFNKQAFNNCIVNGIVLAEDGQKMSKRLNNYPDPAELFEKYSVDAMRYYLLSSPVLLAENLNFSEKGVQEVLRKVEMILWNVLKFYELFTNGHESETVVPKSEHVLDKWILARLEQLIGEVTKNMDNYTIPKAIRPIEEFINDLSTWYIRRSRDRFKSGDKKDKQAALQTTGYVLIELSKVMAPFMPFITEQIWQRVTGYDFGDENKSVHLEEWPVAGEINQGVLNKMDHTKKIVELALAKRDEAGIKVRQPLNPFKTSPYQPSNDYIELIKAEVNVKGVICESGDGELSVELDTELTPELKQEGIKRELVRFINNMRKNAGLTIQDRVAISWKGNEAIREVINKYKDELLSDTLADEIKEGGVEGIDFKKEVKIDNETVVLGIVKL